MKIAPNHSRDLASSTAGEAAINPDSRRSGDLTFNHRRSPLSFRLASHLLGMTILGLFHAALAVIPVSAQHPKPVSSLRVYVMDCGLLKRGDPMERFSLTMEKVGGVPDFADPCILVVHPRGTILWDTGMIPDAEVQPGVDVPPAPSKYSRSGAIGPTVVNRTLKSQLAEIGYAPSDITYLILSHSHVDHAANANDYAGSTWIVQRAERDFMFDDKRRTSPDFAHYSALEHSKKMLLDGDYDVFGDGRVVLKSTPGHSPGHQSMFLKLAKTGPVFITGDLYHYTVERTSKTTPTDDFNKEQDLASRAAMEKFIKSTGAQVWVQHDLRQNRTLKKSPAYYD